MKISRKVKAEKVEFIDGIDGARWSCAQNEPQRFTPKYIPSRNVFATRTLFTSKDF